MGGVRWTKAQLAEYEARRGTAAKARPKPAKAPGGPNATEARFNRDMLGGRGHYEAVTFRLLGGSRYTPDWTCFTSDGRVVFYEVKGGYRLPSEGRALVAFLECRAQFPWAEFRWFAWDAKRKAWTEKHQA